MQDPQLQTPLQTAIAEAKRFLARAEAQQKWLDENSKVEHYRLWSEPEHRRLNAAMKRASMDLTKALPPLRT
jgi:hypothetical protein